MKVYFGTDQKEKYYLPETNKEQWFEIQKMNEGQRRQYEEATDSPMSMNQATQEITMTVNTGKARKAMIDNSVIGYEILFGADGSKLSNRKENGCWADPAGWDTIRDGMPSDIAEEIAIKIREMNPWLQPVIPQEKKR